MRAALFILFATSLLLGQEEAEDWTKRGKADYSKGAYAAAQASFAVAWKAVAETPAKEPKRYEILKLQAAAAAALGQYSESEGFLQLAINWREVALGREDAGIAADLTEVAMLCRAVKDLERGLAVLQRVASMHSRSEADRALLADDYSRIAQFYQDLEKFEDVVASLKLAIEIREKLVGLDHPALLGELDRMAAALVKLTQYDQAVPFYLRALVIRERLLGKESADLIPNIDGLAFAYFGLRQYKEAEPVYLRLLELWKKAFSEEHPMVAMTLDKLVVFYREQNKNEQAHEFEAEAIVVRESFLAGGLMREADALAKRGKRTEAAPLYERALAVLKPHGEEHEAMRKDIEKRAAALKRPGSGK